MKNGIVMLVLLGLPFLGMAQYGNDNQHHSEIGVEIQAASGSTHGGTIGGALRYAYVIDDQIVFGPTFRAQYIWSNDLYHGTDGHSFTYGGGGFFHVRFVDWLYLGADIEYLKNPYRTMKPNKKWALTGLLGGGIAHDFGPVVLSLGIMYDVVDALRNPLTSNASPLSGGYFLKIKNPKNPNQGRYIPLLYRITLFIPLDKNK